MEAERVDGLFERWSFRFQKMSIYKPTVLLCLH